MLEVLFRGVEWEVASWRWAAHVYQGLNEAAYQTSFIVTLHAREKREGLKKMINTKTIVRFI